MTNGYHKVLVFCCVCIVVLFAFAFLEDSSGSSAQPVAAAEATDISDSINALPAPLATSTSRRQDASGSMRTYTNADFEFSLTYPSDLAVTEYDEGGGTKSI